MSLLLPLLYPKASFYGKTQRGRPPSLPPLSLTHMQHFCQKKHPTFVSPCLVAPIFSPFFWCGGCAHNFIGSPFILFFWASGKEQKKKKKKKRKEKKTRRVEGHIFFCHVGNPPFLPLPSHRTKDGRKGMMSLPSPPIVGKGPNIEP